MLDGLLLFEDPSYLAFEAALVSSNWPEKPVFYWTILLGVVSSQSPD